MRYILILAAIFSWIAPASTFGDEKFFGIWQSIDGKTTIEILDGFKAGVGPSLLIEAGEKIAIGTWDSSGDGTTLSIGWFSDELEITGTDSFSWQGDEFTRTNPINEANRLRLSEDGAGFIAQMTSRNWRTSLDGDRSTLKSTFSNDSGVVETLDVEGRLASLSSWSVSSGVLKIADTVIIEARISPSYLVGIDDDDDFFVMKALDDLPPPDRTSLQEEREKFLAAMLTDSWQTVQWTSVTEHKFRPIEGSLKGRKIQLSDGRLTGSSSWEYSPSTGAIKIGYTDYLGGIVVDDTLALLESDGDQIFFNRVPGGEGKSFTTNDVRRIEVNENKSEELAAVFDGQFQQNDYFYHFEFQEGGREGFVHKWRSEPFTVRGQTWSSDLLTNHEVVYEVEDLVILGEGDVLKRDASPSRLTPKTAEQVAADQEAAKATIEARTERGVILKLTRADGSVEQVALPVAEMGEIAGLEIVVE